MKISARNDWPAVVKAVEKGPVSTEVQLQLDGGDMAVATITSESADRLELAPGKQAHVLVKASHVVLTDGANGKVATSARNCLQGKVEGIDNGTVNSEIRLRTDAGTPVVASITKTSASQLGFKAGMPATALIKASDVMLLCD